MSDVVDELSEQFGLSAQERAELLPSGKQSRIANRVHWARSYLKQAGLVRNPKRGWYETTERGIAALEEPNIKLDAKYLEKFEEFLDFRARGSAQDTEVPLRQDAAEPSGTPDEDLFAAHSRLESALARNLLEAVRSVSPAFFETLIVQLFVKMGYGGSVSSAGQSLGQTGDNGVDGVINQDPLGVDQIYLQAKRYSAANTVGSGDIRDFFGALNIKKASKGIFVTTSTFSPAALQTVKDLGARIVTVDGEQLARLMIRHNIGCRDKDVLHVKEIDDNFFEDVE